MPTHEEGTCLFWEFATDNYDIGFGVFFEWTIADSNQVWWFCEILLSLIVSDTGYIIYEKKQLFLGVCTYIGVVR